VAADETGRVFLTFFNQDYVKRNLVVGQRYLFYGKIMQNGGRYEISSPQYEKISGDGLPQGKIVPVYPLVSGLTQKSVAAAVDAALGEVIFSEDFLPDEIRSSESLADVNFALLNIHKPSSFEALSVRGHGLCSRSCSACALGCFFLSTARGSTRGLLCLVWRLSRFYVSWALSLRGRRSG
jgi:ATP-dependent DNA helicase RecG